MLKVSAILTIQWSTESLSPMADCFVNCQSAGQSGAIPQAVVHSDDRLTSRIRQHCSCKMPHIAAGDH